MEVSKLNVAVNNVQVTLEGEGEWVYKVFRDLKEHGVGKLAPENTTNQMPAGYNMDSFQEDVVIKGNNNLDDASVISENNFPSLHNVVLQGTPQTEKDWLLIYAAYCSRQGKNLFTREELRAKYEETNRKTPTREKNFSTNLKTLISNNYISAVNENDFRIELTGLEKASSILSTPVSTNKTKKSKVKKTPAKKKTSVNYNLIDLELSEEERGLFRGFWDNHKYNSHMDKVVLISYWLMQEKEIKEFTPDYIFTMLRTINESITFNILAALNNGTHSKNYFSYNTESKVYNLTYVGEDRVKALEISKE